MKHEQICVWLGLPPQPWPPDHYHLLGLRPGESNVAVIEHQVHDRLLKIRGYQLSHPEAATEAMNRLAQAFMCLTDPQAKKSYDSGLFSPSSQASQVGVYSSTVAPAPAVPAVASLGTAFAEPPVRKPLSPAPATAPMKPLEETATMLRTEVDWHVAPPPVRADGTPTIPAQPPTSSTAPAAPPPPSASGPTPVARPVDSLYDIAFLSFHARRGIGTAGALYERIFHLRQLLWTWEQAGRILNRPKRSTSRPAELKELMRRLQEINDLMEGFPPILGRPGQPGYRVIAMARLGMTAEMFQTLDPEQRAALARDWVAGQVVLKKHRQFLRQELKALRRKGWLGRAIRALRAGLNDHPVWVCAIVAAILIGLALLHLVFWR